MDLVKIIKHELNLEAQAIQKVAERIGPEITRIVDLLHNCRGKIVVTGMGKSGIIARKIAATFSSTGTIATFLHAAEGIHGDLGIIEKNDVILAVSYSGNTAELISMIPYFKFNRVPIIALTGHPDSQLAKNSDLIIDCSVPKEFEPFGMVPTSSTTVTLAVGDAIAIALLKKKDFKESDFARYHPGGTIGRRLILKVKDLMHIGSENPIVPEAVKMDKVILEMTSKGLGCTSIIDKNGILSGIITDGDLRRILSTPGDFLQKTAFEAMTKYPKRVDGDLAAVDALALMEDYKITMLPVVDETGKPIGMLHMHDLINAGVVG